MQEPRIVRLDRQRRLQERRRLRVRQPARGLLGGPLAYAGIQLPFSTAGAILAATFVSFPLLVLAVEAGFRGLDWNEFQRYVDWRPPHAVICLGASGTRIARQLGAASPEYKLGHCASLAEAVALAREWTPDRGVVLLSPGAPSFDQFRDYADRGRAFTQLAGFDPQSIAAIEGLGIA